MSFGPALSRTHYGTHDRFVERNEPNATMYQNRIMNADAVTSRQRVCVYSDPRMFFFADHTCRPVCITQHCTYRFAVPMSPPIYEVILCTSLDEKRTFRGTSTSGEMDAHRKAYTAMYAYVASHAVVCAELAPLRTKERTP